MSLTRQDASDGQTHPLIPPLGVFSGLSFPSRRLDPRDTFLRTAKEGASIEGSATKPHAIKI